jgi:hypothetical protein
VGNLESSPALYATARRPKMGIENLSPIFVTLSNREPTPMHITSPFFVVPVIVAVFLASILFATSSKEDGHESH